MLVFKYYNSKGQIFFDNHEEEIEIQDMINESHTIGNNPGTICVFRTSHPQLYGYGFKQKYSRNGYRAGEMRVTRVGVLNRVFDESYVDISVDGVSYAIKLNDLKEYLPEEIEFKRVKYPLSGDVVYEICTETQYMK